MKAFGVLINDAHIESLLDLAERQARFRDAFVGSSCANRRKGCSSQCVKKQPVHGADRSLDRCFGLRHLNRGVGKFDPKLGTRHLEMLALMTPFSIHE